MSNQMDIPFQNVIDALLDEKEIFNPRYLYRLSDLEGKELASLTKIWGAIAPRRRLALMEDLESLTDTDFLLSFEAVARLALDDSDPQVRLIATRILWDFEPADLVPRFMDLCISDPNPEVRAGMAFVLGKFIYLGEVDEIPAATLKVIEDHLLQIVSGADDPAVRRRALESLGFSGRNEVPALIESAYYQDDDEWLASALFAMGRSADRQWHAQVLDELINQIPAVRREAARAAGELEISDAVPTLLELIDDQDDQVRLASIWSLSQIGGRGVRDALTDLLEDADDEDAEFLENALDNLSFTEDLEGFALFDFSEDDLSEMLNDIDNEDRAD